MDDPRVWELLEKSILKEAGIQESKADRRQRWISQSVERLAEQDRACELLDKQYSDAYKKLIQLQNRVNALRLRALSGGAHGKKRVL